MAILTKKINDKEYNVFKKNDSIGNIFLGKLLWRGEWHWLVYQSEGMYRASMGSEDCMELASIIEKLEKRSLICMMMWTKKELEDARKVIEIVRKRLARGKDKGTREEENIQEEFSLNFFREWTKIVNNRIKRRKLQPTTEEEDLETLGFDLMRIFFLGVLATEPEDSEFLKRFKFA